MNVKQKRKEWAEIVKAQKKKVSRNGESTEKESAVQRTEAVGG